MYGYNYIHDIDYCLLPNLFINNHPNNHNIIIISVTLVPNARVVKFNPNSDSHRTLLRNIRLTCKKNLVVPDHVIHVGDREEHV